MNDQRRATHLVARVTTVGFALAGALAAPATIAQTASDPAAEIRELREELRRLRSEVNELRHERTAPAAVTPAPAAAAPPPASPPPTNPNTPAPALAARAAAAEAEPATRFFGYGELTFGRPRRNAADAVATVRRGVLGWAYRFNDRTRFAAELELENAVSSATDKGEVAFEQFYIEHDLTDRVAAKAGLFLLPVGYLNEVHEPTRYYGVNRNFIETAIIPTTWRELGFGLRGTTASGLRLDGGLVTSFDLTKWDAASTDGRTSPLGSIHQEGSQAKARNGAVYGAANFDGIPGFNVGASLFNGGIGQKQPTFAAPNARVTLYEAHTRWQPGRWDLSALAAFGRFSGVDALNATFAGQPTPVPDRFRGWYGQAAYRLWKQGDYALVPFTRYERFNTAVGFAGLPAGLGPDLQRDTRVATVGASFFLHPQVVLKLDYQRFFGQSELDRVNLGVGFHF